MKKFFLILLFAIFFSVQSLFAGDGVFSFSFTDSKIDIIKKPVLSLNVQPAAGNMIIKDPDIDKEHRINLTPYLRADGTNYDSISEVLLYNNIFLLPLKSVQYPEESERVTKTSENCYAINGIHTRERAIIINPQKNRIEKIKIPEGFRVLYPVSENSILIYSTQKSFIYNSFYKEDMPYYNILKVYEYNFRNNTKNLLFDNTVHKIDFDDNFWDSLFIFDKKRNVLIIRQELNSKYEDGKRPKPQSLILYNISDSSFKIIDQVFDPDDYSHGYFSIPSYQDGILLYRKHLGKKKPKSYLFDIDDFKHKKIRKLKKFEFLQVLSPNSYVVLNAKEFTERTSRNLVETLLHGLLVDGYNMNLVKIEGRKIIIKDLRTLIVDQRGTLTNFDGTIGDEGRRIGFYIPDIHPDFISD